MPPPEVYALADSLAAVYREADRRLEAELATLITNPRTWRRQARVAELLAYVDSLMAAVDVNAEAWVTRATPAILDLAVIEGALYTPPGVQAALGDAQRRAIMEAVETQRNDLLRATRFTRSSVKATVREVVHRELAQKMVTGATAVQAARDAQRLLERRGVHAVVYANGRRVTAGTYATMALRTTSGAIYNAAMLDVAAAEWVEVFDGAACGWRHHDDGDKANGTIRSRADAEAHGLSHPNCRRSFGPRPDIRSAEEAAAGAPTTTAEQRADQAAFEARRAAALAVRHAAQARQAVRASAGLRRAQARQQAATAGR